MNITDAVAEAEGWFQAVHREIGYRTEYTDSNGKFVDDGPRDHSRASNGEPYVTLTCDGVTAGPATIRTMYADEGRASNAWLYALEDYVFTIAPREDWKTLHLYWRERPIFESTLYVAVNQAELVASHSVLAAAMGIELGTVYSRLLVSKLNPDGTEEATWKIEF